MHFSPAILIELHKSCILPHWICSSIWAPPTNSVDLYFLEANQKFPIRMCSHKSKADYQYLYTCKFYNLPAHSTCFLQSCLIFLYKILHG